MANHDVDDVFSDFGDKVSGKKEKPESKREIHKKENKEIKKKELSKKEILLQNFKSEKSAIDDRHKQEADALKEKFSKERKVLEQEDIKKALKEGTLKFGLPKFERIVYIAVIAILIISIIAYAAFFRGNGSESTAEDIPEEPEVNDTSIVVNDTKKVEEVKEVEVVEEKKEPEKEDVKEEVKYSGLVTLSIDEIHTKIVDKDGDLGYVSKVDYTINNDKDKVLIPVMNVFAYDSELDPVWETKSRGQTTYNIGINPGKKYSGSIDLVPKTFKNLDIKKSIRLALNGTKVGFIDAVNTEILIS